MGAPKGHPPYPGGGQPRKYTDKFIEKETEALLKWITVPGNVYMNKFALTRGYHYNRLLEFKELSPDFAEAYSLARGWQEVRLVEGALNNVYNAQFTKFVMQNCHGWFDKQAPAQDAVDTITVNLHPKVIPL